MPTKDAALLKGKSIYETQNYGQNFQTPTSNDTFKWSKNIVHSVGGKSDCSQPNTDRVGFKTCKRKSILSEPSIAIAQKKIKGSDSIDRTESCVGYAEIENEGVEARPFPEACTNFENCNKKTDMTSASSSFSQGQNCSQSVATFVQNADCICNYQQQTRIVSPQIHEQVMQGTLLHKAQTPSHNAIPNMNNRYVTEKANNNSTAENNIVNSSNCQEQHDTGNSHCGTNRRQSKNQRRRCQTTYNGNHYTVTINPQDVSSLYIDIGDYDWTCEYCDAAFWCSQ